VPTPTSLDIAHTIQLAIAPVFLLSSLGTFLTVLSTRLGRIVDRARVLRAKRSTVPEEEWPKLDLETSWLTQRRRIVNMAIGAATVAALLVCLLIAVAFLGSLIEVPTNSALAVLFVLAMAAYVLSLVAFLREVIVASRAVELEHH
jgi:cell division protein FtsL